MSTLACGVCGTPTVPGARYCYSCGSPVDGQPEAADRTAERRLVTVLFGDLSDFTAWAEDLDPERVSVVTDRVLAELTRAVTEVGGHVDKLTGDGIMAVFGAPLAHEDDAERAVRAAAQMQTAVRRLVEEESGGGGRLGLRVGLNTGEVLAGVQAHLAYTVVGDTVNTASRLSDAAGVGSVYAGRETALATMHIASWRALPPLRLKGKREPVPAYELVGLRPAGAVRLGIGEEAPFIGREAEFGLLVGRLLGVMDRGVPATAVITGEAGVGKTRLAAEISRFAAEQPRCRVLWGRCTPYGVSRTLAPLAEWVRTACGIAETDDTEQIAERVGRTVARLEHPTYRQPVGAGVVDGLLALLGVAPRGLPAPREATAPGASVGGGDPVVDALRALLHGFAAQGPLLLVIDDLHWAARELPRALRELLRGLHGPVLLVCVGRSDGDTLLEQWWAGLPAAELVPLAPLDEPAADRLLRAYLGGAELDESVRQTLLERSQGNPFFLAELLHLLVDRGVLRRAAEGWTIEGELPRQLLPAGVQAVLAARVDGLDPDAKAVLRDAAVIGSRFGEAALLAVQERADKTVRDGLATLEARGILTSVGARGAEREYTFVHTLARDVAYAAIPKADRARRHAAVAAWAARLPRGRVDAEEMVAAHAEQAVRLATEMALPESDPAWAARTAGFAVLARLGQEALGRDDAGRAEAMLTRALRLAPGGAADAGVARARTARAAALVNLHRLDEAESDLTGPLASTDPRVRAGALLVCGQLRRRQGKDDEARDLLVSALALAGEAGADRITGEALRELGMLEYLAGRLSWAERRFSDALELAERVGDRHGVGWALQNLAWSATTRGEWSLAESTLARAAAVFTQLDDSGGLSWCAGTEAFVRLLQGRFREARALASGLLPLGEAMGERWGVAACRTIDAFAAAELGELSYAHRAGGQAVAEFRQLNDSWGQGIALVATGVAERGAGRLEQALQLLGEAVECARHSAQPTTEALALTALGYCHLDRAEPAAARAAGEAALRALAGLDLAPHAQVGPKVLIGQALRAQHLAAEGLAALEEAVAAGEAPSLIFPRRQALAHCAGALLELGRVAEATALAERALAVPAEDVRSRLVALRVLAHCYQAAGDLPAARAALRQAGPLAAGSELVTEQQATERAVAQLSGRAAPAGPGPARSRRAPRGGSSRG